VHILYDSSAPALAIPFVILTVITLVVVTVKVAGKFDRPVPGEVIIPLGAMAIIATGGVVAVTGSCTYDLAWTALAGIAITILVPTIWRMILQRELAK
jgi:uncharacterized membrane protein